MPSVAHVSKPSALTAAIASDTCSMSESFGVRHAAPMQKRSAPFALASFAEATIWSSGIKRSVFKPVLYRALCGQYLQSSGQAPVLMLSKLLN